VHFPADYPPLFLNWYPLIGLGIVIPLALCIGFLVGLPRMLRSPVPVLLAALVVFSFATAATLAMQSGRIRTFSGCCLPGTGMAMIEAPFDRTGEYFASVPLVDEMGPRTFAERFPELDRRGVHVLPLHATTHPPGAPMLLWLLWRLTGRSALAVALAVVAIGAIGVLPAYAIARGAYDEPVARRAAVLFACSPAVLVYSATSMDVVFMTAVAVPLAAVVRAPKSFAWSVATGLLAAAALGLTWAALVVAPVGLGVGLLAVSSGEPLRRVAARGVSAIASFLGGVLIVRAATGIDLAASYRVAVDRQVHYATYDRSYAYWILGNVVALLISAGVAQTALLITETGRRWRARRPGLESVLWCTLALSSLLGVFKGETDHNWLFFVPVLVAAAAASDPGREAASISVTQAVATEVLFYTGW
jgi:hypothetical protein